MKTTERANQLIQWIGRDATLGAEIGVEVGLPIETGLQATWLIRVPTRGN